jgi:GNAT superfamily N-acetyltransferase
VDVSRYSAVEALRDGREVTIRSLRPEDRGEFTAAVGRTSNQSIYRRFFAPHRNFTESETLFFVDVDFVKHVALVAVVDQDHHHEIVGGGRYVVGQPGEAELAFMVVDQYQGKGIGTTLLRHIIDIARHAGLYELTADVLSDNTPMLKVFARNGFRAGAGHERGTKHVSLQL